MLKCDKKEPGMRDEMFIQMQTVFYWVRKKHLSVFGVPDKLKSYTTSQKDAKAGKTMMPGDKYKLPVEIQSTVKPSAMSKASSKIEQMVSLKLRNL